MNFETDLQEGESKELIAGEAIGAYFHEEVIKNPDKKSKECDLIGDTFTVEVKYDRKFNETGNIALEYEYKGFPSGIKATKSDLWCIVENDHVWIARTRTLLKWLVTHHGEYKLVQGGDNNDSKMILLNGDQIKAIFTKIK